jgi:hypothetical protein
MWRERNAQKQQKEVKPPTWILRDNRNDTFDIVMRGCDIVEEDL